MKQLQVQLENCHGIRSLACTFNFNNKNANAIYAPNGTMKTSFARTFRDLARGDDSTDHIFPTRTPKRSILDEDGRPLPSSNVVVILSYDEAVGPTEETSTLLVNAQLRKEYEDLQTSVNEARDALVAALKARSKTKVDVLREVSITFMKDDSSFLDALLRISNEVTKDEAQYATIPYDLFFNTKVLDLFKDEGFRSALADCVQRLNELLDESEYFDRKNFNYYKAENVIKSLGDNGFFEANHYLVLQNSSSQQEMKSKFDLVTLIAEERQRISEDPDLRKKYEAIDKKLAKNADVRAFYEYIGDHVDLLPQLENIERFRELVWKSYIKSEVELYEEAIRRYNASYDRKEQIKKKASEERTQWENVVRIFNDRFFVPFELKANNHENLVLGLDKALQLDFKFRDGSERVPIERGELLEVLSTGEKKALYILNVLFEVETRKNSQNETLFVVDDIADSFDYKNKYAIIQYLKDMSEVENFRLLILTHNFDFYRTLESRFVNYNDCYMAQRSEEGVELAKAKGIKNPFVKDFKPAFFKSPMKRIASIPFMRNLLEYTQGETNEDYIQLTSLLHLQSGSDAVKQSELDQVFKRLFGASEEDWDPGNQSVTELIHQQAEIALQPTTGINLENKIVLSIAIRLAAERFMIDKIDDQEFVDSIDTNQTQELYSKYKASFGGETTTLQVLDGVVLMTPEHIHLNSFMYEPILDMSDDQLRKLYQAVLAL